MKPLVHILIAVAIFFVCSPVLASEPSFVAQATGISDATLVVVSSMLLIGGPILGNGLAHLFLRLGWVNAAAKVAQWAPFVTRSAAAGLRAPTLGQAARAVMIEAKKEQIDGPISTAAMHLRDFVEDDLMPIIDAVDPPKPKDESGPKLPPGMGSLLIVIGAVVGFVVLTATLGGCGPSQHPCVVAYEKAGDCPECTAEQIEARIAEVDATCGHMLLGGGGAGGSR